MRGNEQSFAGGKRQGGFSGQRYVENKPARMVTEQNYVEEAEKVIREMGMEGKKLTTSKLRNLLSMTADIYNVVIHQNSDALTEEVKSRIEYLRIRFLYEAGREESVRLLVEKAGLLEVLKNIKGSKKNYIFFNRYVEALVAFHKYYGGQD